MVASEVKELARETAKATEDISRKIETIQGDTRGAVDVIAQISTIINQINDIQTTIAAAVEEQSVTRREMARSVSDVPNGSSEISHNISTMAQAAQDTANGASNTQKAATSLAMLASQIQSLLAQIRVK